MSIAVLPYHKFAQKDQYDLEDLEKDMIFVSEEWAEDQGSMLEVATYTVFQRGDEVFGYDRGGGEERLHGCFSIGVGGHVEDCDISNSENTIKQAAIRENIEEVGVGKPPEFHDIVYTQEDEVSSEHIGAVFTCEVEDIEGGEIEGSFVEDLEDKELETWSEIVAEEFFV